jgi:hypothetical protein
MTNTRPKPTPAPGLAFDVSWDVANGPTAAAEVTRLLERWRALRPLALTLKVGGVFATR